MHTFILAGGFATRLWPLTENRAKPLLPLAGKPIISHPLHQIPESIPITVSTNAAFKDGFHEWKDRQNRKNLHIAIEEAKDDDQKLGALGALAQWIELQKIDDDILLLTGDNYFGFQMQDFLSVYTKGTPILAAYDIKDKEQAKAFGTVILDEKTQTIRQFEEKPKEPKTTLVSTGCSILPKESLGILLEFAKKYPDNVGGIFEELLTKGWQIDCFSFSDPWFDIGSFHAYLEATSLLVGENVLHDEGSSFTKTECKGSIVLGKNVQVKDSVLRNVVVFNDCVIENCILEDCIIDNHCSLKGIDLTGKMLRAGSRLERQPLSLKTRG